MAEGRGVCRSAVLHCMLHVLHSLRRRQPRSRYNARVIIRVNGQEREVPDGQTLRALVESHQLKPEKVAIELNRRLARADKYDAPLKPGDEVEIVTFVGGG